MSVLAVSTAWVGVVGTAVGGVLGFATSWAIHRSERADRIAERSRAERLDAYAQLLTQAENSLHLFEWLAEGDSRPDEMERDKTRAKYFYDEEVTPRYMVLKLTAQPAVVEAAHDLRDVLSDIRDLTVRRGRPPAAKQSTEFRTAHHRYRAAREEFTKAAADDLDPPKRQKFRLARGTGEHPH